MEINGIAHVMLVAGDFERSRAFYRRLLPFLGLHPLIDTDDRYYAIGGRTAFGVQRGPGDGSGQRFEQDRAGLHHVCFRARSREDVDAVHGLLRELEAPIVHPPEEGPWAPGYYSVLFEDPDGARLEVNHVPGRGHLDAVKPR